ncbi:MAG: MFS transporter [Chloroflexota bacterium]|nr:MFS transporter [Chloroflexota bacterium]
MHQLPANNTPLEESRFGIPPALRYPAYRDYWMGLLASVSGFQMFRVCQGWLIYEITGSPWSLGLVGAANAIPAIFFNLFGGVFADRWDKRRLIISTQLTTGGLIFILATLTMLGWVESWHVLAVAFLAGGVEAFDNPARQALYPHLINRRVMMSAVAMNSSIWQGTRIVAPGIAGILIDLINTETAMYISGMGFVVLVAVMARLNVPPIPRGGVGSPVQDVKDGLKFIKVNSIFSFLIGMTFFNSFFGMAYVMLMPIFAVDILEVGAKGQGMLLGMTGAGALVNTLWMGTRGDVPNRGLAIIGGAVLFGLSVAAFALTAEYVGSISLAMALMFFMGIFNSVYMISIQSSLQIMVPDRMRGRVMGFYGMTWSIMPLGGLQASALTSVFTAPIAIAAGGIAVAVFALGPAMVNSKVRNLGSHLTPIFDKPEDAPTAPIEAVDTKK